MKRWVGSGHNGLDMFHREVEKLAEFEEGVQVKLALHRMRRAQEVIKYVTHARNMKLVGADPMECTGKHFKCLTRHTASHGETSK